MIIVGTFVVAIFVLIVFLNVFDNENIFSRIGFSFLASFFISTAVFALLLMFNSFFPPKTEWQESNRLELISLQDNSNISGKFTLGSGQINETMVYSFYYKDDNFVKLGQINCNKTKIQFSNEKPVCIVLKEVWKKTLFNYIFTFPFMVDGVYILQIPENTIIKNFNLDAK